MNVFFTEQVETEIDAAKARVEEDIKVALGLCFSEYKLADLGDIEFMICDCVTDFERMAVFMSNPERMQWYKDNGDDYKG